jgi:hypothetical protein
MEFSNYVFLFSHALMTVLEVDQVPMNGCSPMFDPTIQSLVDKRPMNVIEDQF